MPFAEAFICETLRKSPVLPFSIPHLTMEDTKIGGFDVPAGEILIYNVYAIHHDVKTWGDPENFRPERFLSEDGQKVIKPEAFIPFGSGKRLCPGTNNIQNKTCGFN